MPLGREGPSEDAGWFEKKNDHARLVYPDLNKQTYRRLIATSDYHFTGS